jgi:predicted XRE-type DNA-binding protein
MNEDAEITYGSSNVFRDLGLEDADELDALAEIGIGVWDLLTANNLKRRKAKISRILGISREDVNHLLNGHFSRFGNEQLQSFVTKLEGLSHDR